jgi:hypothetical protein
MTEGKSIPGNQTPSTPDLSETELRRMHMEQLREKARQEGVPGANQLRKDDLVKAISARHRERHKQMAGVGGQRRRGDQQAHTGGQPAEGKSIPGNQTPGTPDLSETELRRMHMEQLREKARQEGVPGANQLRKDDLVKAISARHRERQKQKRTEAAPSPNGGRGIRLPVIGARIPLPSPPTGLPGAARVLWLGGLVGAAALRTVGWPVAAALAAGTWATERFAKATAREELRHAGERRE